jgi:hypothetical protein
MGGGGKDFFYLIVFFVEHKNQLFIFSSASHQSIAFKEMPSQMAAHLRKAVHCRLGSLLDSNSGL